MTDRSSARVLADLARSGAAMLREPFTQVNYEIRHLEDRRGYLRELVSTWLREEAEGARRAPEETLTSTAYGTGLLVATRRGVLEPEMSAGHQGSSAPVLVRVEDQSGTRVFRGAARPNPTVLHHSAPLLEGVIGIEEQPVRVRGGHAAALREVLRAVSAVAVRVAGAPLVSLQSPAQLPQRRNGTAAEGAQEVWGWSSSLAVRFAMALPDPTAAARMRVADEIAARCREAGLGLWLTDTRRGYRSGNWFPVVPMDPDVAARRVRAAGAGGPCDGGTSRDGEIRSCLPLTLIGPARLGTTHAVLEYLSAHPGVGVLGCSVTTLNDLTVVHLLLTGPRGQEGAPAGERMRDPRRHGGARGASGTDPLTVLPACVAAVAGDAVVRGALPPARHRVREVAGDYQCLAGPVLSVEPIETQRRLPVWVSWQVEGGNPGVAGPLDALMHALEVSGVGEGRTRSGVLDGPNVEYLVCREVGSSLVRAKGKLSLPADLVPVAGSPLEAAPTKLCVQVEDVWRVAVRQSVDRPGLEDVAVAWREYWLAHARSW